MPDREYAPKDSRDVTRQQNTPGEPTNWRDTEAADGGSDGGGLAPEDSRAVTAHQNAPGKPTGWQADDDVAAANKARQKGLADAAPPAGVPQQDEPFSAEEAAKPADSSV